MSTLPLVMSWKNLIQSNCLPLGVTIGLTENAILHPRVMVVDSFMHVGEPIVPVRLATLNDVVDRFYIIEGTMTHSGVKKEAFFKDLNADVFERKKDKIHWVIFDMAKNNMDSSGQQWVRLTAAHSASMPAAKEDFWKGNHLPSIWLSTLTLTRFLTQRTWKIFNQGWNIMKCLQLPQCVDIRCI